MTPLRQHERGWFSNERGTEILICLSGFIGSSGLLGAVGGERRRSKRYIQHDPAVSCRRRGEIKNVKGTVHVVIGGDGGKGEGGVCARK